MTGQRRFPLIIRLARIEREMEMARRMLVQLGDDMLAVTETADDAAQRLVILASMVAAGLLTLGIESGLVQAWLAEMQTDGSVDYADFLSTAIAEQVLLAYGTVQGTS